MVHRRAVSPRAQIQALRAAPAVHELHQSGGGAEPAGVGPEVSRGQATRRRLIARASASLIRVCQPGPSALKAATIAASSRRVICAFGRASLGRPRARFAAAMISGKASATGRARWKSLAVHSGLSRSTARRVDLFFLAIKLHFFVVRPAKA